MELAVPSKRALSSRPRKHTYPFTTRGNIWLIIEIALSFSGTMANTGLITVQAVPRFLLPRLSWNASAQRQTIRALHAFPSSFSSQSRRIDRLSHRVYAHTKPNATSRPPSILQDPSLRRAFHATTRQSRDHHFDTLKFVQRLQEEGFSEKQAVAMMRVLSDVIEERFRNSRF